MTGWGTLRVLRLLWPAVSRPRGALDALRAARVLREVQVDMVTRPPGALIRPCAARMAPDDIANAQAIARRWGIAIRRAARLWTVPPTCLARALALHRLLIASGVMGSTVSIGVRGPFGHVEAHAWVEIAGVVLEDDLSDSMPWIHLLDAQPA